MKNKKELAVILSNLKNFQKPKAHFEQYPTPAELAAEVLWYAHLSKDITGKRIVDLGCGNGIFGLGALLLGAKEATLLDIDEDALAIAKENHAYLENVLGKKLIMRLIHADIRNYDITGDVVFQNPPFGVQNKHADKMFLETAMVTAPTIYTMHKKETSTFIRKIATDHHFDASAVFPNQSFVLKPTQKFHTKNKHEIGVTVWKLTRSSLSGF